MVYSSVPHREALCVVRYANANLLLQLTNIFLFVSSRIFRFVLFSHSVHRHAASTWELCDLYRMRRFLMWFWFQSGNTFAIYFQFLGKIEPLRLEEEIVFSVTRKTSNEFNSKKNMLGSFYFSKCPRINRKHSKIIEKIEQFHCSPLHGESFMLKIVMFPICRKLSSLQRVSHTTFHNL